MDEKDNSVRPKRTRVLRAADVMPPFDKLPDGVDAEGSDCEPSMHAVHGSENDDRTAGATPDAELPSIGGAEIPKYDLAENILAEQRRVAARRRRAPSQAQAEPVVAPLSVETRVPLAELPCDDLPELQRIVAEIVARDIDRLCRRPAR